MQPRYLHAAAHEGGVVLALGHRDFFQKRDGAGQVAPAHGVASLVEDLVVILGVGKLRREEAQARKKQDRSADPAGQDFHRHT